MKKPQKILQSTELANAVEAAIPALATTLRPDYLAALKKAKLAEKNQRAQAVIAQILQNAELAAAQNLPICQDTGYVWVCLEVGGDISVPANIFCEVDAAVARAYAAAGLRNSLLQDALVNRVNTNNNTPVFCEILAADARGSAGNTGDKTGSGALSHPVLVPHPVPLSCEPQQAKEPSAVLSQEPLPCLTPAQNHSVAKLHIMLKGGGSDNASQLAMLPPGVGFEGIKKFVVDAVIAKGANACPPLVVGLGVGTTFDKVAGLAKHALLRKIGSLNPQTELQKLEDELLQAVNATGVGPGGLGGDTTALALHLATAPCHIAALPVAVNLGCCALRSATIDLLA